MLLGDKSVDLRPEKSAARLGIEDVNGVKEGFLWDPDEETVVGEWDGVEGDGVFKEMLGFAVMSNNVTFVSVVRGCGEIGEFVLLGGSVLGLVVKVGFEDDVSVYNSFITVSFEVGKTRNGT
ncbi:hypothetical protein CTI12_AA622810 [Artemisia annua]|uniref:Uncharacterized protein n=1 Tax=Artemisia annua TaxID=35608 RepID=A0A2U1KAY5_ARTAN|nr:hypothetical protein CTI12_AA622810 [Artemisia annua]